MTTTAPRPKSLPCCASCGHFKLNHSSKTTGPRPHRCLAKACGCPGYVDADGVAAKGRKAARTTHYELQQRLFGIDGGA